MMPGMTRFFCICLMAVLLLPPPGQATPNGTGTVVGSRGVIETPWPQDVPKVLSEADAELYRKLFDYQRRLRKTQVEREMNQLENEILVGNLHAIRLLHPLTRASYAELAAWLEHNHDHSSAAAVFELAEQRVPRSGKTHRRPSISMFSAARYAPLPHANIEQDERAVELERQRASDRNKLLRKLRYYRLKGRYESSLAQLAKADVINLLGEETWGKVCVTLMRSMLHDERFTQIEALAKDVDERLGIRQPAARWLHGMALYRQGNTAGAARIWRQLAYDVPTNSVYFAQGAWWAATAYTELGRHAMARVFVNMAAQDPYTFYGQLALAKLDRQQVLRWRSPYLDRDQLEELLQDKGLQRVIALAQIGEYGMAQAELRTAYERFPYAADETLLALALRLNLAGTAQTLANNLREQNKIYLNGLFPMIEPWLPADQIQVGPALLHAFIRQESAFDPSVISHAGARGLMQLMPATARYIRQQQGEKAYPSYRLFEPAVNVGLGQDYLFYLKDKLGDNLLALIAAYNAGPGNAKEWLEDEQLGAGDPILFIESIPFRETRRYVKKILANYWLYQHQFGHAQPTLQSLANGRWPQAFLAPLGDEVVYPRRNLPSSFGANTGSNYTRQERLQAAPSPAVEASEVEVPADQGSDYFDQILEPPQLEN